MSSDVHEKWKNSASGPSSAWSATRSLRKYSTALHVIRGLFDLLYTQRILMENSTAKSSSARDASSSVGTPRRRAGRERLQPADLDEHAFADQAELRKGVAQIGRGRRVPPVDGGHGRERRQREGVPVGRRGCRAQGEPRPAPPRQAPGDGSQSVHGALSLSLLRFWAPLSTYGTYR